MTQVRGQDMLCPGVLITLSDYIPGYASCCDIQRARVLRSP